MSTNKVGLLRRIEVIKAGEIDTGGHLKPAGIGKENSWRYDKGGTLRREQYEMKAGV